MSAETWHARTSDEVLQSLSVGHDGLSAEEAQRRLESNGANELVEQNSRSALAIFAEQFTNIMVAVLVVAAVVSALTGDLKDSAVITVILVLNAALGFFQEYRAEKAMKALKQLSVPAVRVTRGGQVQEISSRQLVPGDILHLETGCQVGADARLIENVNCRVEEAALTGESVPVEKCVEPVPDPGAPIGDRRSMVFMGTAVTYGRGRAVVVATGMQTELGRIANMLQRGEDRKTPLQLRLAHLGKWLAAVSLAICAVVFFAGAIRGEELKVMFLTAVSLAVAAIPESLPAVITVALALGAQRMVRRHALIRRLPAVETLGCVTTICSDKTGTLTQNKMTANGLYLDDTSVTVTGSGYDPEGQLLVEGESSSDAGHAHLDLLLKGLALCNDAHLVPPEEGSANGWGIIGDPTEGALVVLAAKAGLDKPSLELEMPRVGELPFDSDRKRMTTFHRLAGETLSFTKGAVDGILGLCSQIQLHDEVRPMTAEGRNRILGLNDELAAGGQRVLAVACRRWPGFAAAPVSEEAESDLTYLGLVSMIDPPRQEAADAVAICLGAGIKPVMITGDHRLTAEAIARKIGILQDGGRSVTGTDVDTMDDESLLRQAGDISVYSRVSPVHKMRVVEALQSGGHVVAMTGDGVNDAPALKRADIGVAMGITGTDVSKEASDMVLTNDNFATIVGAVAEGRAIYDNVRKFIRYMLTTNSAEIFTVAVAILVGLPLPLLAIHILWINLVTDGLPALALGFEPAEPNVMRRPPRRPKESLFARGMWQHVIWAGVLMGVGSLGVLIWGLENYSLDAARTMTFFTLAAFQMAHVMAIRSETQSTFKLGLRSNLFLAGAVALTLALQFAILYVPFAQSIFQTVPLTLGQLAVCIAVASTVFFAVEGEKALFRSSGRRRGSTASTMEVAP